VQAKWCSLSYNNNARPKKIKKVFKGGKLKAVTETDVQKIKLY